MFSFAFRLCLSMATLPVTRHYTRTADADRVVKKDGRLFGLDRQAGLGVETCYRFLLDHGRLNHTSVRKLQLRGVALEELRGRAWVEVSGVDVVLSQKMRQFLVEHVKRVDEKLSDLKYGVTRVDKPMLP